MSFFDNPRTTAIAELKYIMEEIRPKIVVTRKNRLIFDEKLESENQYIDAFLQANYKVLTELDGAEIRQA